MVPRTPQNLTIIDARWVLRPQGNRRRRERYQEVDDNEAEDTEDDREHKRRVGGTQQAKLLLENGTEAVNVDDHVVVQIIGVLHQLGYPLYVIVPGHVREVTEEEDVGIVLPHVFQ